MNSIKSQAVTFAATLVIHSKPSNNILAVICASSESNVSVSTGGHISVSVDLVRQTSKWSLVDANAGEESTRQLVEALQAAELVIRESQDLLGNMFKLINEGYINPLEDTDKQFIDMLMMIDDLHWEMKTTDIPNVIELVIWK